jgi:hypothetical protein
MSVGALAVGTVFAKNYISFARVLAESLRRHHPHIPFVGVLADRADGWFEPGQEPFEIIELADLDVPTLDRLAFRYQRVELSVVAKTYLLQHLLDRGYEAALFVDADSQVLGDISALLEAARRSPITVVPHLLTPLDGPDRFARELNILQSGVFNGGVVGVSDGEPARRFLSWWQDRVDHECRHSLAEGLHYDQRWLDLIPAFFPEAQPFRDARCNVAHWNLTERGSEIHDWRHFHFSGYEPSRPDAVTRYAPRLSVSDAIRSVFMRYQEALEAAGWRETSAWPYAYASWDNSVPIPDVVRDLYHDLGNKVERFGDPFATAGADSFFRWLNQSVDGDLGPTRLWTEIRNRRPDVQTAFPDPLGADRGTFLAWTKVSGAVEHDVPDALLRV